MESTFIDNCLIFANSVPTKASHLCLFLFLNLNFVIMLPADFITGDFLHSEKFKLFPRKGSYQFSSYEIASSPVFMLAL